jgi:hypothetical protein
MDPEAARRARRRQIKADLTQATTDDEASPPEWVDLLMQISEGIASVNDLVEAAVARFVDEEDIRRALKARDRDAERLRACVREVNRKVQRLNLVAPLARFHRRELDAEAVLKPLLRARRHPR